MVIAFPEQAAGLQKICYFFRLKTGKRKPHEKEDKERKKKQGKPFHIKDVILSHFQLNASTFIKQIEAILKAFQFAGDAFLALNFLFYTLGSIANELGL